MVAVGVQHAVGHSIAEQELRRLERRVADELGLTDPDYTWSGQHFHSADGLPYIGRDAQGLHVATGFGTDGLTYGTLAAQMISDAILARPNPWADLYKPGRINPLKAAKGVLSETANTVGALVRDYVTDRHHEQLDTLAADSGAILQLQGHRVAAYRSPDGTLSLLSAVCTHMKCVVHWNGLEKSWDCPCHGSRFSPDGKVLQGPALRPLPQHPGE